MIHQLSPILQRAIEDTLQGKLSLEQAQKLIKKWPAQTQCELRQQSDALLILSALSQKTD